MLVLFVNRLQSRWVDVTAAYAARFQRYPTVAALFAVFLQNELAVFPTVKIGHLRVGLADAIEKVQHGFPARGQLHFGVEVDVHPEIIAQGAIGVHWLILEASKLRSSR